MNRIRKNLNLFFFHFTTEKLIKIVNNQNKAFRGPVQF